MTTEYIERGLSKVRVIVWCCLEQKNLVTAEVHDGPKLAGSRQYFGVAVGRESRLEPA